MRLRHLALVAGLTLTALACNGKTVNLGAGNGSGAQTTKSSADAGASETWSFVPPTTVTPMGMANKVDILLAVDNSQGMAEKTEMLAAGLKSFLDHVAAKTPDIHLGVITSSLGNSGGDVCTTDAAHADNDTRGHLQRSDAATSGVLAMTQASDLAAFEDNAAKLVRSVGDDGCGLESQLESMYRFLIQPDPWDEVVLDPFVEATLGDGIDVDVLADRKAFLRPDSLVVVLMLTDEDDASVDPLSVGGFGYAFKARNFPGSNVPRGTSLQGTTAPRGTGACATNPADPSCTSCGFGTTCDQSVASCQAIRSDKSCTTEPITGRSGAGYDGFYAPDDDDLNVRFSNMKERFGVDPQFPMDRYRAAFGSSSVPDRAAEHAITIQPNGQPKIAEYTHHNTCTNPLFATGLPEHTGDELCHLARGPRTPAFVMFGLLTGIPSDLGDTSNPDWAAITGNNPDAYDYAGIDARMIPSTTARTGLSGDWNTTKKDLEYACVFKRATPLDCSGSTSPVECRCFDQQLDPGAPPSGLCSTTTPTQQIFDSAYPAQRELRLARGIAGSDRMQIGSICDTDNYASFLTRFGTAVQAKLQ